ncbi:MAG TPA: hypothetical protein VIY48_08590 [Candidatus Paceibacterota bacterium]
MSKYSFSLMQRVRLVETDGKIGTIQQIIFAPDGVQYQVSYWLDSVRRVELVFAHEIAAVKESPRVIA